MLNDLRDTFGYKIPELFPKGGGDPLTLVKSCPLEFWYDGKDASTFTLNGVNVIQWDDKSGHGRHVLNAVDARRPSYNATTGRVSFIAVNSDYLQSAAFGPLAQPNTIFILYKTTGAIQGIEFDALANRVVFFEAGAEFKIHSGVTLVHSTVRNNNDNIHVGLFNGAASNYWINGILTSGDVGNNNLDGITIGARNDLTLDFADAEIMEVFGYNCIITTAERIACENYLTSKWSL